MNEFQKRTQEAMLGAKIISIEFDEYLNWDCVVKSITLDNGKVIEFYGNADVAYVASISG